MADELYGLWSEILRDAAVASSAGLAADSAAGSVDLRALHTAWVDAAEGAYARTVHGDPFCAALATAINTDSRSRLNASVTAGTAGPGCSPKDLVWTAGKLRLYRYRPLPQVPATARRAIRAVPLLVVYALVNRPHLLDMDPDRSLIRGLLTEGLPVYLIDWGYPDAEDRHTSLSNYVEDQLAACVAAVLQDHGSPTLDLFGVCQGGVFSLCCAALHPELVRNLVTMVTPVDFHTPNDLLSKWVRHIDFESLVADRNLPGEMLSRVFTSLQPFRSLQQKYVDFWMSAPDARRIETFMRVERWLVDCPDQAGVAFREFAQWLYQENRLARNELCIAGKRIDLERVELPVLNLIGARDHLVPRAASTALGGLIGSRDYTLREFDLGHIGMSISASAQQEVPATIGRWLACR